MSLLNLLLLTVIIACLSVAVIYHIYHTFLKDYAPAFEDVAPRYASKLRKKKRPPALDLGLGGGGGDVEAQSRWSVAVGGGDSGADFHAGFGGHDSSFECGDEGEGRMATGVDVDPDREVLSPFSPARARARKYGEGMGDVDVEACRGGKGEEEDEMGLGRYFFGDGVGVMRYESSGKARGWKEG